MIAKAEDAYGEFDPDAVITVSRESPSPRGSKSAWAKLCACATHPDTSSRVSRIALTDDSVELDLNHPMAGKDLHFKVTVPAIRPGTEEEIAEGHLHYGGCESCSSDCGDGCGSDCC